MRTCARAEARGAAAALVLLAAFAAAARAEAPPPPLPWPVVGDSIPGSLTGRPGDAARGRAIVADRQRGLCLLCHGGPFPEERFQGTLAPSLAGVGARLSAGQIRLRLADGGRRANPDTLMPAYLRTEGLTRVAPAWRGRPVLTPEELEDVVAFLTTLREG